MASPEAHAIPDNAGTSALKDILAEYLREAYEHEDADTFANTSEIDRIDDFVRYLRYTKGVDGRD